MLPRNDFNTPKTVKVTLEFELGFDAGKPQELIREVAEMTNEELLAKADPHWIVKCEGWQIETD